MSSTFSTILLHLIIFVLINQASAGDAVDTTLGFTSLPLSRSKLRIERSHDVPRDQRYSFVDGVHKMWVYKTDKPHIFTSTTSPRTEVAIKEYYYSSGVWQFEGYMYVPRGTTGPCIMQVFGAARPYFTTAQLRVYNGSLTYYRSAVLVSNIYDKWYRVNVIHDKNENTLKVYIDGILKYMGASRNGTKHYFKFGVYMQNNASNYMESRWKNIKIFKK